MVSFGLVSIVMLMHFFFLILEMFLWQKPVGLKTFRMTADQAKDRAVLAANQGLYNGFLGLGLCWSLIHPDPQFSKQLSVFFLVCIFIAALYGGYSVNRRILTIQGVPALLGLLAIALNI